MPSLTPADLTACRIAYENAKSILAIGYFISETPGATTFAEAAQFRGMPLDQAAEEIRAAVARSVEAADEEYCAGRPER